MATFDYKCPECGKVTPDFSVPGAPVPSQLECPYCHNNAERIFTVGAQICVPDRHKAVNANCDLYQEHCQATIGNPEFMAQVGEAGDFSKMYRRGTAEELKNLRGTF